MRWCIHAYVYTYILHIPPYLITLPLPLHFIFTFTFAFTSPYLALPYPTYLCTYVHAYIHTFLLFVHWIAYLRVYLYTHKSRCIHTYIYIYIYMYTYVNLSTGMIGCTLLYKSRDPLQLCQKKWRVLAFSGYDWISGNVFGLEIVHDTLAIGCVRKELMLHSVYVWIMAINTNDAIVISK